MNTVSNGVSRVPTLSQVWTDYCHSKVLKETTKKNYAHRLSYCLGDWLALPIDKITKDMVEQRHKAISGNSMANSVMRTLRALLRYAAIKYEDPDGNPLLARNPVSRLTELKSWHKDNERTRIVPFRELGNFRQACLELQNTTARDYLLLLLFTGLRSHEAAKLMWKQIDLKNGTIIIPKEDAKNGQELEIPMSTYLWQVMSNRRFVATTPFVFPGKIPKTHISNIAKSLNTVKSRAGIQFCLHDLRRTFVSIADEVDVPQGTIKQLVNHKRNDITEKYTFRSTEKLRRATQRITDKILSYHSTTDYGARISD